MKHLKSLASVLMALMLALALPCTASAEVSASLLNENHEPLGTTISINDLEDKKLILCLKGGSKFQGVNINLFDADGKRVEKAISFWGGGVSEAGHHDVQIILKRGSLQSEKKYSFKVSCVLKNDSGNVMDTSEFSFTVGEPSKDEDKDEDKKDDGADDKKDDPKPDDDKKDDSQPDDKQDDTGNNGKGDQGGSGSGNTKGDSGKTDKGSADGKESSKLDKGSSKTSDSTNAKDDSSASATAATEEAPEASAAASAETPDNAAKPKGSEAAQEQLDSGTVLGAMGAVYSLGDGSQPTQGNTGGGAMPVFVEVTDIPWLLALLVAVLVLALPAGVAKRLACERFSLKRRSRLRSTSLPGSNENERLG